MKTALVMTGLPRDFEKASVGINEKIIDRYNVLPEDIYVHVWSNRGYWVPGDSAVHNSFLPGETITESMLRGVYPEASIFVEDFEDKVEELKSALNPFKEVMLPSINHSNYIVRGINLVSMLYKIGRGLGVALSNKDYQYVIRTRPDILPRSTLPRINQKKLIIAKQANHFGFGVGDNLHIGPTWAHRPIGDMFDNLHELFQRSGGLLCPHLLTQVALEHSGTRYSQRRLAFRTLHTPSGMYKVKDIKDGIWKSLDEATYSKRKGPFRGKSPD